MLQEAEMAGHDVQQGQILLRFPMSRVVNYSIEEYEQSGQRHYCQ
jgi:hypothetical protein